MRATAIALALGLLSTQPTSASLVVGDALGTTGWVVDDIDAGLTLGYTNDVATDLNGRTVGELRVDANHTDFTALKFRLRQVTPLDEIKTSNVSGGLRIRLDVVADNNTPSTWSRYRVKAEDQTHMEST